MTCQDRSMMAKPSRQELRLRSYAEVLDGPRGMTTDWLEVNVDAMLWQFYDASSKVAGREFN